MFALAPPHGFLLGHLVFHRLEACAFVGTITERLAGGTPTGTPPISAGFHFKRQRFRVTNDCFFRHTRVDTPGCSLMRGGNWKTPGLSASIAILEPGLLLGDQGSGISVRLLIVLRRHLVTKSHHEPSQQYHCRATDKIRESHRIFKKCLLLSRGFCLQ